MCEILFFIQLEPVRLVLPFDWFTTDRLVSGESTLHWVTLFSARSRIFLPIAQSCAALFCCCLAIRASSLGCLVGNKCEINYYKSFVGPLNSEGLFLLDHCQWFVFSSSISSETNQKIFSGHAGSFRQR